MLLVATIRVLPSGAAFAPAAVPIVPPAPARFSTMTGWPSLGPSSFASMRATVSVEPPAVNGTMIRMEWFGQLLLCAVAGRLKAATRSAVIQAIKRRVLSSTFKVLSFCPYGSDDPYLIFHLELHRILSIISVRSANFTRGRPCTCPAFLSSPSTYSQSFQSVKFTPLSLNISLISSA